MILSIDVNTNNSLFVVHGDMASVTRDKKIMLSLKRMNCSIIENVLQIPYREGFQIQTLQELERIFTKFGYKVKYSEKTTEEFSDYEREQKHFEFFSNKAYQIRNNEFSKNSELVELFNGFQSELKEKLHRKLYPLQLLSAFHMAFAQNSCNFAVPGAGKTSIVYGAYAYLKSLPDNHPQKVDFLMVIGPLSSFAPWENEYKECFGKEVSSFRMSGNSEITRKQKEQHLYSPNPAELTLIFHGGVETYQTDIIYFLKRNKTMVVVDEAHRIKNHEGVWGRSVSEISKEAKARVALTGTPAPNGYQDIYNLYKFIYPFKYKEIIGFHYHNLADMTQNNQINSERVQTLKQNLSPYFMRIKKADLNLPPIEEKIILIDMDTYQREIYDFIEARYIEDFKINCSATIKDALNKAKLIRLRQASTNPSLLAQPLKDSLANSEWEYDPNAQFTTDSDVVINDSEFYNKICNYLKLETPKKFAKILELLNCQIINEGEKVIIWTIFIQNAKQLQQYFKSHNINSNLLIGEIPQEAREETIRKFNDPNNMDFQVIIANPFSVAESISLHKGCHNAIYLERDYNCSNFLQSKDRIHRVGLKEGQVTKYYYIVSKDSIDLIINQRLNLKIERMEEIINDDIPLLSRINDIDETDIIQDLIADYAQRP